jgi:hypothetical protein
VPVAIKQKRRAIPGPVRCLEANGRDIGDVAIGRGNDGFQSAVKFRLSGRRGRSCQLNFREDSFLYGVFVVRANSDSNVKRSLKRRLDGSAGDFELAIGAS